MATLERLFMGVFDRRNGITCQLNAQGEFYDQALASSLLIHGIDPPPWLRSSGVDAQIADFRELKASILFPPPHASAQTNVNAVKTSEGLLDESLLRIQRSRSRQKALELRNSGSQKSKRPREEEGKGEITHKLTGRMTRSRTTLQKICNVDGPFNVESSAGIFDKNVTTQSQQFHCTDESAKLIGRRVLGEGSDLREVSNAHVAVMQEPAQVNEVVQCNQVDDFVIQQDKIDTEANVVISEVVGTSQPISNLNPAMFHGVSLPGTHSNTGACGISKQLCFDSMEECNLKQGSVHADVIENSDSWVREGDGTKLDPAQSLNGKLSPVGVDKRYDVCEENGKLSPVGVDKRYDVCEENVVPVREMPQENQKALEFCNSLPSLNKCLTEDEIANKPSDGISESQTAHQKPYNVQEAIELGNSPYIASKNSVFTRSRSSRQLQRTNDYFKLDRYQVSVKGDSSKKASDTHIAALKQPTLDEERMECSETNNIGKLHVLASGRGADMPISEAEGASLPIISCTPVMLPEILSAEPPYNNEAHVMPRKINCHEIDVCSLNGNFVGSYRSKNCDQLMNLRGVIELDSGLSLSEKAATKKFSEKCNLSAENLMVEEEALLVAKPLDRGGGSFEYDSEDLDGKNIDLFDSPALESTSSDIHMLRPSPIQYAERQEYDVDRMEACKSNENSIHVLEKVNFECPLDIRNVAVTKSADFFKESFTCQELEKNHTPSADELIVNQEDAKIPVSVSDNMENLHGPIEGELNISFELLGGPFVENKASEIPLSKPYVDTILSGIQNDLEFDDAEKFNVNQNSNHSSGRDKRHPSAEAGAVVTELGYIQFKAKVDVQGSEKTLDADKLICYKEVFRGTEPMDKGKEFVLDHSGSQAERKLEPVVSSSSNNRVSGILPSKPSPEAKEHIDSINFEFSTSGNCSPEQISCVLRSEIFNNLAVEGSSEHNSVPYQVPLAIDHLSTLQELSGKVLLENQLQNAPDFVFSDPTVTPQLTNFVNKRCIEKFGPGYTDMVQQNSAPKEGHVDLETVDFFCGKYDEAHKVRQSLHFSRDCVVVPDTEDALLQSRSSGLSEDTSLPFVRQHAMLDAQDIMDNAVKLEMSKRMSTPEAVQSLRPDDCFLKSSKNGGTTAQQSNGSNHIRTVTSRASKILDKEQVCGHFPRSLSPSSQDDEKNSPSCEADICQSDVYNSNVREGFQQSMRCLKIRESSVLLKEDLYSEENVQGRYVSDTSTGKQICETSVDCLKHIELSSFSDGKEVKYPVVTEEITVQRKSCQEGQSSFPNFQKSLTYTKDREALAYVESPELKAFTVSVTPETGGDDFSLNNLNLSCLDSKSANFLDHMLSAPVSRSTVHTLPESLLSLPTGLLEKMNLCNIWPSYGTEAKQPLFSDSINLSDSCYNFGSEVGTSLQGGSYSYTPPIRKVCSKSAGSSLERHLSISTELTCFRIDEDSCIPEGDGHLEEVLDPLESSASSSKKSTSNKRSALVDVTSKYKKPPLNFEVGMLQNRESVDSVRTDHNIDRTQIGVQKHEKAHSGDMTLMDEEKNHSCLLDGNVLTRSSRSHVNGAERLNLSQKISDIKNHPSYKKGSRPNNIVSNVDSFIPFVQKKQKSSIITGKRDIRVKALEAAEAAKKLEEERAIERKMRKEAARLERERLEQENLRRVELDQKRKEEEKKKKEADVAARKRQREEKEKEEKERKRRCIEEARKLQKEREEKLRAEKTEKEMRRKAVEVERKQKAVAEAAKKQRRLEKVRQGGMCGSLAESQERTTIMVTNNYEKTCNKNEDVMVTIEPSHMEKAVCDLGNISKPNEEGLEMTSACHGLESYEISPYQSSDDEKDEEEDDDPSLRKYIPQWARENCVNKSLECLQFVDPDALFLPERCPSISGVLVYQKK